MNFRKAYVKTGVVFDTDGVMMPKFIVWEDGRTYKIDRVTDVKRSVLYHTGGVALMYRCFIQGKEKKLYFDDRKWFVETMEAEM